MGYSTNKVSEGSNIDPAVYLARKSTSKGSSVDPTNHPKKSETLGESSVRVTGYQLTEYEEMSNKNEVHEDEIAVSDVTISEPQNQESDDSETDNEGVSEFTKPIETATDEIPLVPENVIIIFDNQSNHLQHFNPRSQTVTQMHEYKDEMKRSIFTSVCIGDYIYVLKKPKMYRLKYCDYNAIWERMPDLIGGHGDVLPAVAASGTIIVAGGGSSVKETKSVTKYEPTQNRWEKLKDKRLSTRFATCVASRGQHVYCLGGMLETAVTDRVERMDIDSQTWDEVAPMREARFWASAVECDGKLFIAGGWTRRNRQLSLPERHLNSVEKYDPVINQWTIMKPMKVIRFSNRFRLHLIKGKICAVGQSDRGIEKYDFKKDEWEVVQLPDLRKLDIAGSEIAEMM